MWAVSCGPFWVIDGLVWVSVAAKKSIHKERDRVFEKIGTRRGGFSVRLRPDSLTGLLTRSDLSRGQGRSKDDER